MATSTTSLPSICSALRYLTSPLTTWLGVGVGVGVRVRVRVRVRVIEGYKVNVWAMSSLLGVW